MAEFGDGSGPNNRVVEVMNFLAAHPTESFTLAEIASRLGLSNGSAHRVLTTLAEARYLTRHPRHKTYSLGLVMVAIGQAALSQHRDIDAVRQEVALVARELRVQCMASAIVSNEMLVVACEGTPANFAPANRVGERWPFVPPLGMGFIAWADQKTREEYLARAPAALSDIAHERLSVGLEAFRRRGYGMAGDGPVIRALRRFTSRPAAYHNEEAYWSGLTQLVGDISEREIQLLDVADATGEGVSYIIAPVFSAAGEVAYEIGISGFPPGLTENDIERYVDRVRTAAANVTMQLNGSAPWIGGVSAPA
ncbi:IclR family transcriptional regulator [Novosphingobium sp. M1R2S20]|uniref:IclR family transcriptional regulator n=1 Tax=Novosphingobium rhizovicinum TaxID=3228928 RepID=A0ABV3R9I2_9SPHN